MEEFPLDLGIKKDFISDIDEHFFLVDLCLKPRLIKKSIDEG
jgi:hypothetical protein